MQEQTDPAQRPVPGPPPGHPAPDADPRAGIEEAVTALEELGDLPVAEHVERFDAVHTELAVALSSIDKV
ncbi:hypothetical protein [Saccharomonospora marina]|uniref:hypothetical protein n=1 Tax=Saccharomonospora marina TaxID=632569 RepID=UPI0005954377|nr:hypothetical protein [Saccharomonospora marina]